MQLLSNVVKGAKIQDSFLVTPPDVNAKIQEVYNSKHQEGDKIENVIDTIRDDAINKAALIIEEAKKQSHEIIKEALTKANVIREESRNQGYNEGYNIGYKDGYDKGYKEGEICSKELIEKGNEYIENVKKGVEEYLEREKDNIVELLMVVVEKIVKESITKESVYSKAEDIIAGIKNKTMIVIKVSKDDYEYIKEKEKELVKYTDDEKALIVVVDPNLEIGDLVIETLNEVIDARLETQINEIKRVLKESVGV